MLVFHTVSSTFFLSTTDIPLTLSLSCSKEVCDRGASGVWFEDYRLVTGELLVSVTLRLYIEVSRTLFSYTLWYLSRFISDIDLYPFQVLYWFARFQNCVFPLLYLLELVTVVADVTIPGTSLETFSDLFR